MFYGVNSPLKLNMKENVSTAIGVGTTTTTAVIASKLLLT